MKLYGIDFDIRNSPVLDPSFMPFAKFIPAFLKSAEKGSDLIISIERENKRTCVYNCKIHGTKDMQEADRLFAERIVKFLLWQKGGFRIYVSDKSIANYLCSLYCPGGKRAFDEKIMSSAYENKFEVLYKPASEILSENDSGFPLGGNLDGCRIGFDAGGSDRKVSAVIDGEAVFSEEVIWHPKTQSDPDYHYEEILSAFKKAAEHMPKIDAIGVSSAGIFVNNRCMGASLFIKVPEDVFEEKVKDIFIRCAREFNVPLVVCNDGDVAALAGMMGLNDTNVLGIAMGTSEAGGYVDEDGNIRGWLNELAFAPVDLSPAAAADPWSGDIGVGAMYFSQDAVIKLAPAAGIVLDENFTPAEKLKVVQELMAKNDKRAQNIFSSIGVYLGHSLALYHMFYGCRHVLLMGRVMSGLGGDIVLETANHVLLDEYPEIKDLKAELPDEKTRRVGQSVAAASLPQIS